MPPNAKKEPYPLEKVRSGLEMRLKNNHLHWLLCLLPESQHLATPAGRSPLDPTLEFPAITPAEVVGTPIGNLGMSGTYEIGYLVDYAHWNQGYASEALADLLRAIWRLAAEGRLGELPRDDERGEYVAAVADPEHKASRRVLVKAGGVDSGFREREDWGQTQEERDRDGVKMFKLALYKFYKPEGDPTPVD